MRNPHYFRILEADFSSINWQDASVSSQAAYLVAICRVSETEVKGALQAITTQMQAQQDVCTERIEEMQRRLQRQEQETKVNLSASSTEYADVIKRLQDTIDEERVQAKAAKDSFQKQLRVTSLSFKC